MIKRSAWARFFVAGSLGCVLAMTQGCGLVLTHGPPVGHEQMNYFNCTESRTGPILDLALAGFSLVGAVSAATDSQSDPYLGDVSTGFAVIGALEFALYATSSIIGMKKTSRCREARQLLADRLATQGLAGAPPRPGQPDSVPSAVHVYPAESSIAVGEHVQLTAAAMDSQGVAVRGRSFVWTSSDDAVASVDAGGLVTGSSEGRVMIAANTGGVVGLAEVVVTARAHLAPLLGPRTLKWRTHLQPPGLLPAGVPGLRLGLGFTGSLPSGG
jgi:hypothetical protein